jgi:hypothetical protein
MTKPKTITEEQAKMIRDHLALVFTNVTSTSPAVKSIADRVRFPSADSVLLC